MSPKTTSKTRSSRRKGRSSGGSNNIGLWIVGISGAVVALAIVVLIFANNRNTASAIAAPDVPTEWLDRTSMGNPDAAVVIETWEDFMCPGCKEWSRSVKPKVIEDYVKAGLVRMEFNQFPLQMHAPGANMAANASECAADQGAFWTYHDRLFQVQERGQPAYQFERLVQYADELGLDRSEFSTCMTSQKYASDVADSVTRATANGLSSTPSVIINGRVMPDPFNYRAIQAEFDMLLEASDGGN